MATVSTGTTTIKFGSNLRIGYRPAETNGPYTYLSTYPAFGDLPFEFVLAAGTWEVEFTELCPNCSGPIYSDPVVTTVTVV